ncbi:MAG TPA: pantetheine-phosphate adenylyltransferase [Chitinophagales bacterium]|nr:pantetheine-phosphate adenylyltransferase [Chitinophagales bacterium]
MNTVICPFSGDPITYGHIDIIERAAHTFPRVIAAIGINPLKQYLFSIEERLQMAKAALAYLPNVEVGCYEGLLADFARQKGTTVVVRGIRNGQDFNYEWMLHQINESIDNTLETFWIPCRKEMEKISSTNARNGWKQGNNISALVPPVVVQMLEGKR